MSEPDIVTYVRVCGLCGERVEDHELTALSIPSRRWGMIEYNAHVGCVQRVLHATVNPPFDPEDIRTRPSSSQ